MPTLTIQVLGGVTDTIDVEVSDEGATPAELKDILGQRLGPQWRYAALMVDGRSADYAGERITQGSIVAALRQISGAAIASHQSPNTETTTDEGEWVPTACGMCVYGQCATRVHVVKGVAVKVEGNPEAPHNLGRLCPRGNSAIMDLYDPYRVKVPLKRTNPEKGLDIDPRFVEITWEEAMDIIVEKLKKIREEDPRQFLLNKGVTDSGPGSQMFQLLFGGAPVNRWSGSAACGSAEHAVSVWAHNGFVSGHDPDYTELLVLSGTNAGFGTWLGGAGTGVQRIADARVERGMKVVVIDPRCSEGGNKANEWIPIRPGTDLALYLSLMNVMLHELNQYDVEFMKKHTNGPYLIRPDGRYMRQKEELRDYEFKGVFPHSFNVDYGYFRRGAENTGKPLVWDAERQQAVPFDDPDIREFALEGVYEVNGEPCLPAFQLLKDRMQPYRPEWAEDITTIPASTIRRLAADWVKAAKIGATIKIDGVEFPFRPVAMNGYHGSQRHYNGMFTCMALRLVNAMVGNYDVPGGNLGWDSVKMYRAAPPADGVLELFPWVEIGGFPPNIDLHEFSPLAWEAPIPMTWTLADEEVRKKFKVDYTIKAILNNVINPFRSMGEPRLTEKAMKGIEFVISHAVWIDDPALFADIVLPDTPALERLVISVYGGLYQIGISGVELRQPVVKPVYDTKSLAHLMCELAERLGFYYGEGGWLDMWNKQMIGAAPFPARLDPGKRYTYEEIVDVTLRARFGDEKGLAWFSKRGVSEPTVLSPRDHYHWVPFWDRRFPIYFEPLLEYGKLLRDRVKENIGLDWDVSWYDPLPRWEACPEHDASKYPADMDLYLINYKSPMNTHSATAGNAWLGEIYEADPYFLRVWMNEETGQRKGIKDGDRVTVESLVGKAEGRVRLSQTIHPEVVGIAGAMGSWATNPFAKKGINYASLIPLTEREYSWMLGNNDWCTRVKVEKAGRA